MAHGDVHYMGDPYDATMAIIAVEGPWCDGWDLEGPTPPEGYCWEIPGTHSCAELQCPHHIRVKLTALLTGQYQGRINSNTQPQEVA